MIHAVGFLGRPCVGQVRSAVRRRPGRPPRPSQSCQSPGSRQRPPSRSQGEQRSIRCRAAVSACCWPGTPGLDAARWCRTSRPDSGLLPIQSPRRGWRHREGSSRQVSFVSAKGPSVRKLTVGSADTRREGCLAAHRRPLTSPSQRASRHSRTRPNMGGLLVGCHAAIAASIAASSP